MINSTIKPLPKSTIELEIKISWNEIKDIYTKIFNQVKEEVEVDGFRKGKAPKELLEKKINKTKIYEEVIKEIIPKAYSKALSEHKLTPVSSPKIEIIKAKENEEWIVKAQLALRPKIILKNYKYKIKEIKQAKVKIWTPRSNKQEDKEKEKPTIDEIIKAVLSETEIEISDILVNEEVNRLLSNLIDQTQKLGLTVEQYLISKSKTSEQLKEEYKEQAIKNLSLEFIFAEIADKENITVTPTEIDQLISKIEKPEEQEKLRKESYYLAHLLRQQKTLEYLSSL